MTTRLAPILRALVDELYPPEDNQGDGDDHSEGTPAAPSPDLELLLRCFLFDGRWRLECADCGPLLVPTRDLLLEGIRPRPYPEDPRGRPYGFRRSVTSRRHALEAGWLHAVDEHADLSPFIRTLGG